MKNQPKRKSRHARAPNGPDKPLPARSERKSRHLPTKWPKIGAPDIFTGPSNMFLSAEFRDRYRPGESRAVYVGACLGLRSLSARLQLPIYKPATCAIGRVDDRFFELRRDRYGALWRDGGQWVTDAGWNSWFPSHLRPAQRVSPDSPVLVGPRVIEVKLPANLAPVDFDRLFDQEVRKGALDLWSMTPEGRQHCAAVGVDPAELVRFTEYPGWRRMPTQEIAGFSIFDGSDRLIALCETIILENLGLSR